MGEISSGTSPEEQAHELFKVLSEDVMAFGKCVLPAHFGIETPDFHYKMILEIERNQFVAIAAPRGSAKSTRISFLYPTHKILFKKEPFIVLVSNTFKKAAMYLDAIKMEMKDNQLLRTIFRDSITMARDAEGDTIFQHRDGFKTLFLCKGVDQIGSLRGVKFGAHRPGLVLLDDIEDDELVRSRERRQKLQEEFDDVFGIGGSSPKIGHAKTKIIAVGTVLHDDSQLAKLLDVNQYKMFKKIKFQAHLNVGTPSECSLWPAKWSVSELREMMTEKPNVYAKEMQNDPVAGENVRFKKEDFRYWKEEHGKIYMLSEAGIAERTYEFSECQAAIACDLAWKEKRSSDYSVILVGLLTPLSDILVAEIIYKKGMKPDETGQHIFSLAEKYERLTGSTVPIGFEKAMLENVTKWFLRKEMQRKNKFLMTKELAWDADKETRIMTRLQPRYAQHSIYHKQGMGELEHQLSRFPTGAHDDLIDGLQGVCQLLQYPKSRKKQTPKDDAFMRIRKLAIEAKKPRPFHGFGRKVIGRGIPALRSPL